MYCIRYALMQQVNRKFGYILFDLNRHALAWLLWTVMITSYENNDVYPF